MKKVILVIICLSFMVCSNVYGVKQELKGVKIVLDAGHGGFDNGTMDYGYKEDDINLEIILKLKEVLKKEGAKVYLTRDGDYDMTKRNHHYSKQDDMYLRVKKIDRFKADYLIVYIKMPQAIKVLGDHKCFIIIEVLKEMNLPRILTKV